MSIQAYQRAAARAETPRQVEYRAFALANSTLIAAQGRGRSDLVALCQALDLNRRLWTLLANDCALEGNGLPEAVRAQIISISLWVGRYSSEVVREGAGLDPLIEINRTMMEGLSAS